MPRVKRGVMTRKRHNRILNRAKGYWGARHRWFKMANEAVMHAAQYAYRDRRVRKREFRKLWIVRLSAAAEMRGLRYSRFIHGLRLANIQLDRKSLSELAIHDPETFDAITTLVRSELEKADAAVAARQPARTA